MPCLAGRCGSSRGFTLLELLLVLGMIAVMLGLLLPAVQKVRDAAARASCGNNLRQLGLAFHQHHDAFRLLPPGVNPNRAHTSWHVDLLPYLEQEALARDARLSAPYPLPLTGPLPSGPHQGLRTVVPVFGCPSDGRLSYRHSSFGLEVALTSYLGVLGRNRARVDGVLYWDSHVRLADITDGASSTLVAGERPPYPDGLWGVWYSGLWGGRVIISDTVVGHGTGAVILGVREPCEPPRPVPGCCGTDEVFRFGPGVLGDPRSAYHFWSLHSGGANFLFADGSVRFLPYSAEGLMPALATRAGGEVAELP